MKQQIIFQFPIDGDCLNARDGRMTAEELWVPVTVRTEPGCQLMVQHIQAEETDGCYTAEVPLNQYRTLLTVKNMTTGEEASITVFLLPEPVGKYRISSDDNILFLADLHENRHRYQSIFENPYLAVYKKAHDLYGAKVHLNLFYAFDREAAAYFGNARADFDLSMMTDAYKEEWQANADWLKLSFHARAEKPDKPYKFAASETLVDDYHLVRKEVIRFAGEETFCSDVTTVHWGEATREGVAALRSLGHRALAGYFELDENGDPLVAYYLPKEQTEYVGQRDFWVDTRNDVLFARIDRVTNIGSLREIMADMEQIIAHPHRGGFVSFMIHEQYFYEDYVNYLADFEARVLEPARLLHEHGYCGSFLKEFLPENA